MVKTVDFFCKTMTAYELRVSDWNSDVSSADGEGAASDGEVRRLWWERVQPRACGLAPPPAKAGGGSQRQLPQGAATRERPPSARESRMRPALLALLVAAALSPSLAVAADETPKPKTTQELLDASQPSDWRALDPASTLYLELASGRVVVELAPDFAPEHAGNIRTLAHEG